MTQSNDQDQSDSSVTRSRMTKIPSWTRSLGWLFDGRHPAIFPLLTTCLYLLILFLIALSYFFGSLFKNESRVHKLHVLAVDYDGGAFGEALRRAYSLAQSPDFVTLDFQTPTNTPLTTLHRAFCDNTYWGVVYTHAGATERLRAAINGSSSMYNSSDTLTIIYSGVDYPVIGEADIDAQLEELATITSEVLYNGTGADLLAALDLKKPSSLGALLHPLRASIHERFPANQGSRVLLNTVTMIAPPLMQFFFVMALDHISSATHIFSQVLWWRLYFIRLLVAKLYGFMAALVVIAVIFAFRESWQLTAAQFLETWMCFWLYMDICYVVMDTFIGVIVPLRFAPFFIFSWVITGITSTLFPLELSPAFYKWGYALPAHEIWVLLIQIWSSGCASRLTVALPVLLTWVVVGHCSSAFIVRCKCKRAQASSEHRAT